MSDKQLVELQHIVGCLRQAIDRAKAEHPEKNALTFISHWPKNCCDAPYLWLTLYDHGIRDIIKRRADVSHYGNEFGLHVWMVVNGITIDITADQFPEGQPAVIVSRHSAWHDSLRIIEESRWVIDNEDEYFKRCQRLDVYDIYSRILPIYGL